jgi:hypothetical protein
MVEVTRAKYPLNPTLKLVDAEGRATAEFFRILRAIGDLINNIAIEDGEITTQMLEAEIIRVSTLFADEVIITGKVAPNAITELTAGLQVGLVGPNGDVAVDVDVPVTTTNNTGVLLVYTAVMTLPTPNAANFGTWGLTLQRNGVTIDSTPLLYYDDNFMYPVVASFVDETPGTNPNYTLTTFLNSGLGLFALEGGLLNCSLLKR